jgi:site-specific DNA-methyltransferase (adenine-specific)
LDHGGLVSGIHASLTDLSVPLTDLTPLPGNPRRGDVDAVVRSYSVFGQRKPIVARRTGDRDGRPVGIVIAGNHQLAAAEKLGWPTIAAVWTDDDEMTAKAFALADNRTSELGVFDEEALAVLGEVSSDAALLAAASYTEQDLLDLLNGRQGDGLNDPDEVPDAPADPRSQPGDLWLLGEHRVLCGDSTDADVVARVLDGHRADIVWTDPPYGVEVVGGSRALSPEKRLARGGKTIENDALSPAQLEDFLGRALSVAAAVTSPGGVWYVTAPTSPLNVAFGTVLHNLGIWRQTLVWVKDSLVMGRSDFHYRHEAIFYGWKPGAAHRAPPHRNIDTVWEFPRPKRSAEHPTMKPVALIDRALANSSRPGDVVLDPFAGSGSTLIAAHGLGRKARCVELDPRYVDVICRRYQEHAGEKPVLEASGEPVDFTEDALPTP